jgi:DNA-binding NtrC family response regulator
LRAEDLDHEELLELEPEGGVLRFAGQRVLLIDAVAMGLLRKYLVENFGVTAARAVLTQFGFAHGWRMAEAMRSAFKWDSAEDWRAAGSRLCALEGLFRIAPGKGDARSKVGSTLVASYEAEQHLLHFGMAEQATCWTICGLISGYLSKTTGTEIYVLEDRCLGKGDAACHLVGRTKDEWGDERADELRFFDASRLEECLDVSLERVTQTLKVAERRLQAHKRALNDVTRDIEEPLGIVAKSPLMRQLIGLTLRVARVDTTVLITGESGSGKERIARFVHEESSRAPGPFIAVNCGAITETLLESELFGHRRGAFTGATQDRIGLFEAANGGSLLLDEIGEISTSMQVKLLRVLQEREVRRVGDSTSRMVDVRLIAATNRDLVEDVASGRFRQDLFYRLNVVELHVPPLRERQGDVLPLARLLLAEAADNMKREVTSITPAAADQLVRYHWPGNVRELANAMERAVVLAEGARVEVDDLPEEVRRAPAKPNAESGAVLPLAQIEKDYILSVLALNGGNQTHAAKELKISSATLYRKLKRYGLVKARNNPTGAQR